MSNDNTETSRNTDVASTPEKQTIEKQVNGVQSPAATPTVRPWTSDFLLPSISFREPKRP